MLKFPKACFIRTAAEYQGVFKARKKKHTALASLYYRKTERPYPRVGVITAKKNIKQAVSRNRFRRITKESVRLMQKKLAHYDLVVVANKAAKAATNAELRQCLEKLITSCTR